VSRKPRLLSPWARHPNSSPCVAQGEKRCGKEQFPDLCSQVLRLVLDYKIDQHFHSYETCSQAGIYATAGLIFLGDDVPALERGLVVILILQVPLAQLHLGSRQFLVGNLTE